MLGGFAILFGLNVFWALIAMFVGTFLGLAFTSLHAVQGPRLGVPQMIQSRGQFGFYGAVFVFLASIVLDVGYLAAQQVVQAQSLNDLTSSVSIPVWIIIVTIPAVLLAIFGYDWIHRIQPALTVVFAGALLAAVILTATSGDSLAKGMGGTHLSSFPIFIAAVGLFFMNMLSWAVYVSDYSRYLPQERQRAADVLGGVRRQRARRVPVRRPGHLHHGDLARRRQRGLARLDRGQVDPAHPGAEPARQRRAERLHRDAGAGERAQHLPEGGGVADGPDHRPADHVHRRHHPGRDRATSTFLTSFENFINVLLFFFVPWSVINLVDFYLVKKGRYDVTSFFTPKGIYGGWRWTALIPYVIALGAQVPFIDQTLYVGPMVSVLGGADISWLVGFVVAGVGYLIAIRITGGRTQVAAAETQVAASS